MKRGTLIIFCILLILPIISADYTCGPEEPIYQPTITETCNDYTAGYECSKASDGSTLNGWFGTASTPPPKWIEGDLGEIKCVSGVRGMVYGDYHEYRYDPQYQEIQISTDKVIWTTVKPDWAITEYNTWDVQAFPEIPARYIRFNIYDCSFRTYYALFFNWYDCDCPSENICNFQEFEILTRTLETCTSDCTGKECGSDDCDGVCPPGCINLHGTTSCNAGTCQPICDQYYDDCDGITSNGCETDLRDPLTCGDCTTSCNSGQICSEGSCITPPNLYWTNMKDQPITEAEIGDTVLMIYSATDATTFEIKEDDIIANDPIRTGPDAITGTIVGDTVVAKFTITQEDYNLGDDGDTEVEFYFQVNTLTSDNLIVQENSYNNQPPTVTLVKPTPTQRYKIQTDLDFEQIAEDEDDDLKITWDFGDQTTPITITNCLTTTNCNTTHSYLSSGSKTVTLTAEEITRTQKDSESIPIFLYKSGINLFPVINKPKTGAVFPAQDVDFDASWSYVAKCSSTCPTSCVIVDDLMCVEYRPTTIPDTYNLWFDWTFTEGLGILGNHKEDYNQVVEFTKTFFQPTTHRAYLKLGYNELPITDIQWSDEIFTEFDITTTGTIQCLTEDDTSYWRYWNGFQLITEEVTDELQNCYNENGKPSKTCCPNNKIKCITEAGDDFGKCITSPNILYCSDYSNIDDCNNFHPKTAERSVDIMAGIDGYCGSVQDYVDESTSETCWYFISCECIWDDETDPGNPACISTFSKTDETCADIPTGRGAGTCTFRTVSEIPEGGCDVEDTDYTTYTWNAEWIPINPLDTAPADCIDQTRKFACENRVKMPFFTSINFIITLITITLIYTILIIRKNITKERLSTKEL